MALMKEWGFTFKTVITWVKVKKSDPDTPSMKTGHWYRGATEHVLFGVRGKTPKPTVALPTAFIEPRINQHSRKPERYITEYVEPISPGPYLEMFSRTDREGWTTWGNQTGLFNG